MNAILGRVILSIVTFGAWGVISFAFSVPATLITGQVAGAQFENSDQAFIVSQTVFAAFHGVGAVISFCFFLVLVGIWWRPFKHWVATITAIVAVILFGYAPPAHAYYDTTDYTEAYFILPNESAFFVPDVGANKDSQASFGTEQYLQENKIPAKRFIIPHAKLPGSGAWSNYYVPTGRLIVVDRTPFSREWVAQAHRGTSPKDESFPCQSSEGLDASVGVAIGASVTEANAAKFLYRFGVKPPAGDRSKPEVIFTSVFYGRSLSEVMDGPVRSKVQSLVCDEFTTRPVEKINSELAKVREIVEAKVRDYLASVGITLDFFGWADTVTFDAKVQAAMNRRYEASQDVQIAMLLQPYTGVLQALSLAEATRTLAGKWNGAAPSTVSLWWLPSSLNEFLAKVVAPTK